MNRITNGSFIGNSEFNHSKQDVVSALPKEIALEIFSYFNFTTLGKISCVSKRWKLLANEPLPWKKAFYREIAFGNDKWAKYFGEGIVKDEDCTEEFSSLPLNEFIDNCKKFKALFPEKNAKNTLMLVRLPKTLNGQLTLNSLGKLAKNYFDDIVAPTGYRHVRASIPKNLLDKSIDKSRWVLMTTDILPTTKHKTYNEQQLIINDLAQIGLHGYRPPTALEATTCVLAQYFNSKKLLFSDKSTRCSDEFKLEEQYSPVQSVAVGYFSNNGLEINIYPKRNCLSDGGMAALREF
jgi:hypothetical protein